MKKKEITYYNHKLVESYRNAENKPRQRIIMSLGNLSDLPKACWKEIAVSQALIIGRLIHPSSELVTHQWFNEHSAFAEMLESDIQGQGKGKDSYYAMGYPKKNAGTVP
ncbi:hypothetical protein [Acetobacterium sp.]|uniref:hypothetical protein n=1 Tax=Acetobacterium sp. TaxID=1872094 RepID=UPI002F408C44